MTWQGTSGNGWLTGIPKRSITTVLIEIRKGPAVGSRRVVKGGSWLNPEMLARCSTRIGQYPAIGTSFIGFRLAKDADSLHEE